MSKSVSVGRIVLNKPILNSILDLKGLNLYLIGMMGCGKTTIGQLLAQKLRYRFCDTDAAIVQSTGYEISQIFAESGEPTFRQIETQVLSEISAYTRLVVATGGGIILERMNWSYLHQGLVVWLDVPLETLIQRLQWDTTRPLLQEPDPQQKLEHLLKKRQPLYAQADLQIKVQPAATSAQVVEQLLTEIPKVIRSKTNVPDCDINP
jgi:shikimate kinase